MVLCRVTSVRFIIQLQNALLENDEGENSAQDCECRENLTEKHFARILYKILFYFVNSLYLVVIQSLTGFHTLWTVFN